MAVNNLLRIATLVLVVGLISMLLAPFLFTRVGYISFSETGQIGDTIGGITAPITSLVGSVLVFLALRAQVIANQVTQIQIQEQKKEEQTKKELMYISELCKHFTNNFQNYEAKYFKGYRAIMKVMSLLAEQEKEIAHDDDRLYYGTAGELYGILKLGKLFLQQLIKSKIDEQDKQYFKELAKHHYDSFVLPYLIKNNSNTNCKVCGEMHNGIPFRMLNLIHETTALL